MRSLTDFLATLPGIMPRKTRKLILDGNFLSETERADIHYRDGHWLDFVLEVGPDAASAILSAYMSGHLPMKRGSTPADAPQAEEYLAQADKLRSRSPSEGGVSRRSKTRRLFWKATLEIIA